MEWYYTDILNQKQCQNDVAYKCEYSIIVTDWTPKYRTLENWWDAFGVSTDYEFNADVVSLGYMRNKCFFNRWPSE